MLLDFTEETIVPTGVVEHTDLTDIDRAVARFFMGVVDSLVVTDAERPENKEFATFVKRDKKQKMYLGTYDTHQEFLKDLVSKSKTDEAGAKNELLPVFYMSRDPSLSFADGSDYVDQTHFDKVKNENGEVFAVLSKSFVKVTYTIHALAWNKSTLSRMGLGLAVWLRHIKKGRKHTFKAKTSLAHIDIESSVSVDIPKDLIGTPSSMPFAEGRLNALTFTTDIVAEVYEAEAVTMNTIKYSIGEAKQL